MAEEPVYLPGRPTAVSAAPGDHPAPQAQATPVNSTAPVNQAQAVFQAPLARFLPPLPAGMAETWLKQHLQPGSWVIDPFGSAPHLAIEAAQAGYRVLVAANNPIVRIMVEMLAAPPGESAFRSALAELASAHKGDERLEPHIKSLYLTECAQCGQPVMAHYFIWERQAASPYAKVYQCENCKSSGEHPTSPADQKRAAQFTSGGLHRARALERIAPLDDPDRVHVQEALEVYLPRAVYAVFTLINKLEGLPLQPEKREHLAALLLAACDQANTLWPHPSRRERPKQLTNPPRFREYNVWMALENAIKQWGAAELALGEKGPVTVTTWPAVPPETGGISLFEGRLKDLAGGGVEHEISAVLSAMPRPNQAFWTLSALWAGWLWGREAVGPFKSVLRRRRYDWAWHTTALNAALQNLVPLLSPGTPFFGLLAEPEAGFLSAALISAERAGLHLDGLAGWMEDEHAQITWRKPDLPRENDPLSESQAVEMARQAAQAYFKSYGQPAAYLRMHAAALAALAKDGTFNIQPRQHKTGEETPPESAENTAADTFAVVQAVIKEALNYRGGFLRLDASEQGLETGYWWLRDTQGASLALADRVEMECVKLLQKSPGSTHFQIDTELYKRFPGLLTPDPELVDMCLESYGEEGRQLGDGATRQLGGRQSGIGQLGEGETGGGGWRLREADVPSNRRKDLEATRQMVVSLGERLGFKVRLAAAPPAAGLLPSAIPFLWETPEGQVQYLFYVIASAAIDAVVFSKDSPVQELVGGETRSGEFKARPVIVLPGSRANLVAYKMANDPRLRSEIEKGWLFVKYRHLRRLSESPTLSVQNLDEQLDLDPLAYSADQMRLL